MRSNLPISNIEDILKGTETVTSKTDLHSSNIPYLINISEYTEDEWLGAPLTNSATAL